MKTLLYPHRFFLSPSLLMQRKGHVEHCEKMAICKPGKEPAPETDFASLWDYEKINSVV